MMDHRLSDLSIRFGCSFKDYQKVKNPKLEIQWTNIRDQIAFLRKKREIKRKLTEENIFELADVGNRVLKLESVLTSLLSTKYKYEKEHSIGIFTPLKKLLDGIYWPPEGFHGLYRAVDIIDSALEEIAFYFSMYREDLLDVEFQYLVLKRDATIVRYSIFTEESFDKKMESDIYKLLFSIRAYEKDLKETASTG